MSAAVRAALAAAANTVSGISCSPYYKQTTKSGDAMVRLERINYPNRFGGVVTWQVLLILPQDVATAEKYLEDKVPGVVAALSQEMVVSSVTPRELILNDGVRLPCVSIEGTREEE